MGLCAGCGRRGYLSGGVGGGAAESAAVKGGGGVAGAGGPDSALQWGFFDAIFEQKEYGEAYVLEKLAREMMAKDPKLKAEFERKMASDPAFAGSAAARLEFFYERSPWFAANRVGAYPVGRLLSLDGVPVGQCSRSWTSGAMQSIIDADVIIRTE